MNRIEFINGVFERTDFQTYLEIGCEKGLSFFPIKANQKIAVDPYPKIYIWNKLIAMVRESKNMRNKYFVEESDVFFRDERDFLKSIGHLDVVLVDGLHTFRAALSDVLNSLKHLNQNGIIIMHDCLPPHAAAALPSESFPTAEEVRNVEGWTGEWCGDVWKTIPYLRKRYSGKLEVCVLNCDFGLGIVRPAAELSAEELAIDETLFDEIDKLEYRDMVKNPKDFINMMNEDYAQTILGSFSK